MPIRTSYSETPAYCDLDTSDFDSQLCQQSRNSTGLDAVSYQRRYTFLRSCAILDASPSFATSAEGTEAFSSFILETAQLYLAAIAEGPDLRMAAKGVEKGQNTPPDMTKCSLPQLSSYVTRTLLGQGLLQPAQTTISSKLPVHSKGPVCRPMTSLVMGFSPPHSGINVGDDKQEWLALLHLIATHRPAHLQHEYTTILIQAGDLMPVKSFPAMWETATMIMLGNTSKEKYGWKVQVTYLVQKYVARTSTQ